MKQIRVLIVENLVSDEELLLLKLTRAGYEVKSERVESAVQMKKALAEKEWDVIVSDYEMPGFNGMEAHRILQKSGLDIPFIIVSGSIGEDIAVQAMLAGVNDYLMKDNIARLVPAIERELKSAKDREKQRETEKALQETAERYHELFEGANDVIYTVDFNSDFTSVNKKGEDLFGCSREEILQSRFNDFLDQDGIKTATEFRQQKIKNIVSETRYEINIISKTGEEKIVEINSRIIYKNGKPLEIVGIARDITERKKLENDQRETSKNLSLALNAARMGVWEWNNRTNSVFWSDECYSIIKHKSFNGTLQSFEEIIHPEDAKEQKELLQNLTEGEELFDSEYRIINDEGNIIWISNYGIIEYDNEGKPLRTIGTVKDITAEKQLEQNLAATEARFRTLAENNVAGVTLGKADGGLLFVNDAYLNIIGYSREEFESREIKWSDLTLPELRKQDEFFIAQARKNGKSEQYEKVYIRRDGSRVPVLIAYAINKIDGEEYFISTILDFTERKKLENDLGESAKRLNLALNAATMGVWEWNIQTNDVYWSPECYKILKQKTFGGKLENFTNIVHPEDLDAILGQINRAIENKKVFSAEYRIIAKDGEIVWVFDQGIVEYDEEAQPFRCIGTFTDITERKKAEKELSESGDDFRALVKATSQGVWTIGDGGENEQFNEFWQNLTGQTFEESRDLGWLDVIHPEDREFVRQVWHASFTNYTPLNTVYRVLTVRGKYNYFAVRGIPVFDENGEFRKWIGTFSDITERKEVEEELRKSEERLQLSQQSAKIGTWEWNLATNETIWSDGVWHQFGLELESITTNYANYMDFVLSEDLKSLEDALDNSVKTGDALDTEYKIRRTDGKISWICAKGSVVYDKSGNPERMVGVTIDITDRKTAEENLHKTEENLRQAQKLESIGRLAGGIAHDFNNMLTAINGYSDLTLRDLGKEHPLRSNIQEIKNAGERSAMLTKQLLAFSRQQILQPKILKINAIISEITTLLKRLIGENVQLVTDLHPAAGQIKADPGQITQVIMNLAVNSRDAIKQGGTITIETKKVKPDGKYVIGIAGSSAGNYVLLAVTDNGCGMDSKIMEHIFEPFYTTKEKGIGTGLGLATVYGIIEQSGGYIEVRSEVGKGSTFEIYLPQVDDETETVQHRTAADSQPKGKETIFIVEDEEVVRKLTRQILNSYGYRVIEAKDGTEALEMCQKEGNDFDLLLTDVVMPQMGGFELSQHLLKMLPPFPILFTSGYTEDLHLRHELVDEDSNFIHKPFTPESLALKIRKILDER